MKKHIFLFTLTFQIAFFVFCHTHDEFQETLQQEQAAFLKQDLQDIESVKYILNNMYQLDQSVCKEYIKNKNDFELQNFMIKMDEFHVKTLQDILKIHGWIVISKFGWQADHQAWLLVQHADSDPVFQAGVLFLLTDLYKTEETNKQNYAYLYDRVALNFQTLGMKQKYGTQVFIDDKGQCSLRNYQGTIADVNLHREQIGLEPVEEYLARVKNVYN